jgi:serine/threonine protein kinase
MPDWRSTQLVDVASGLKYMHGLRMVHGDLKGVRVFSNEMSPHLHLMDPKANILINKSRRACLADFGLSTITGIATRATAGASQASLISSDSLAPLTAGASRMSLISDDSLMSLTAGGTCRWMSPELLDPELFGVQDDRPTRQSDCYALGMVVYEVGVSGVHLLLKTVNL